jgi:hypothetical protein
LIDRRPGKASRKSITRALVWIAIVLVQSRFIVQEPVMRHTREEDDRFKSLNVALVSHLLPTNQVAPSLVPFWIIMSNQGVERKHFADERGGSRGRSNIGSSTLLLGLLDLNLLYGFPGSQINVLLVVALDVSAVRAKPSLFFDNAVSHDECAELFGENELSG